MTTMDVTQGNKMEYRGYLIKPSALNSNSLTIALAGKGGKIPRMMEGLFTSKTYAMKMVDLYLDSKGE